MVNAVGRHASRWLPSLIKPQHRFLVAISAIALLAFATLAIAASVFPAAPEASAQPQNGINQPPAGRGETSLVASYAVLPNAAWDTGFQAQVTITNPTDRPYGWQVTLAYPPTVTNHVGSWVDGVPQPNMTIDDQRFTFTSTVPLGPGRTAVLRAEFTRVAGTDFAVRDCTVNGRQCSRQ
jgi:cellulose binding protein with CBM2 domain